MNDGPCPENLIIQTKDEFLQLASKVMTQRVEVCDPMIVRMSQSQTQKRTLHS